MYHFGESEYIQKNKYPSATCTMEINSFYKCSIDNVTRDSDNYVTNINIRIHQTYDNVCLVKSSHINCPFAVFDKNTGSVIYDQPKHKEYNDEYNHSTLYKIYNNIDFMFLRASPNYLFLYPSVIVNFRNNQDLINILNAIYPYAENEKVRKYLDKKYLKLIDEKTNDEQIINSFHGNNFGGSSRNPYSYSIHNGDYDDVYLTANEILTHPIILPPNTGDIFIFIQELSNLINDGIPLNILLNHYDHIFAKIRNITESDIFTNIVMIVFIIDVDLISYILINLANSQYLNIIHQINYMTEDNIENFILRGSNYTLLLHNKIEISFNDNDKLTEFLVNIYPSCDEEVTPYICELLEEKYEKLKNPNTVDYTLE